MARMRKSFAALLDWLLDLVDVVPSVSSLDLEITESDLSADLGFGRD